MEAEDVEENPPREALARGERPLVAIGASAGGLEALREFLAAMPADTGARFVFVQHLDPTHKSILAELLARYTEMQVLQATDGLSPGPNTVVLIPPDTTLTYSDGRLHLDRPAPPRKHRTPIDSLFESVASALGEDSICVVLSGSGSDGTHGTALVKEAGGLTIVQDPKTAKYDSMPRNAVATGFVDHVLAPADIPAVLIDHLQKQEGLKASGGLEGLREQMTSDLTRICGILRARTGHDFRDYKEATLLRRIHRRMQVLRIGKSGDYVDHLRDDPQEVGKLLREVLISVTGFFRDPAAFDVLAEKVIEPMVEAKEQDASMRLWVPGCASGEEAYSLAMIVHAAAERLGRRLKVQVFATDIDERALEIARRGCYAEGLVARVPEEYRERYFRPEGAEYRISDELRETCIFSSQSVVRDPPFSRLDLISCRNLLIYLNTELKSRLIPTLHYALQPGGALFLGSSENVTKHGRLFEAVDAKWRIFRRRDTETRPSFKLLPQPEARRAGAEGERKPAKARRSSVVTVAERLILDELGPAYVVVNQSREVSYAGGPIGTYLTVPKGAQTQDILSMTPEGLRMDVRTVLHRVMAHGESAEQSTTFADAQGRRRRLILRSVPLAPEAGQQSYLLAFVDQGAAGAAEAASGSGADTAPVEALERELAGTKEYLQTMTEELESSNEELKSANEELMSMNEELQSSNEELETSKEELQSVNEELETVNSELAGKVEQLSISNSDLENLLQSTQIATIFLDRELRVRRFTPVAKELFHLIDRDIGRSLTDIAPRTEEPEIAMVAAQVLDTLRPVQRRIMIPREDRTFLMSVLPYRTVASVVDGVVATFVDITPLTRAQGAAERRAAQQDYLASVSGAVLRGLTSAEIIRSAPSRLAELMGADFSKVLRWRPETGDFVLEGLHGFNVPEGTIVPGGMRSQAGYTLSTQDAVISEDLATETRFTGPQLLLDHGVRSGISTVVRGPGADWGVLGIHSRNVRTFSPEDINFVKAVANLISTALEREVAIEALRESEERHRAALRAGGLGVHDFDPRTRKVKWDETVRDLWGISDETPVDYDVFMGGIHPEDRASVQAIVDEALDARGSGHFDATYRVINALDGEERWVRADGDVTFENGTPVRLVGTAADVTQQRRMEEHFQLLMGEVNHRAKNLLAVVQSIARQTARQSSPQEFIDLLGERLQGLAASQDLIIRGNWRSVLIEELVAAQLSHLNAFTSGRITLHGTHVVITPAAAQAIGLALHELATNAVKYGALSNETGGVAVNWGWKGEGEGRTFTIRWTEHGGPSVTPPTRRGFGTTVIERMVSSALGGRVTLDYPETGLVWTLEAPEHEVSLDRGRTAPSVAHPPLGAASRPGA